MGTYPWRVRVRVGLETPVGLPVWIPIGTPTFLAYLSVSLTSVSPIITVWRPHSAFQIFGWQLGFTTTSGIIFILFIIENLLW
ncbi:uncharacterized protein F5891DRAFT_1005536 [Suillus fuscotomentosus]|uniref:Uncharacterized protein n=1 Tax=Suillus fuscotomentosus TaxID=1912939 RepID=A0AAD4HPT2_9AGAM|nr:uncharacterized protein F5891DRAFT_1005536 [Suillus fuscotomentosus]KAG1905610.1 hypothetical protein F5891DRAFT_1005536 [Suillus fuscotomentosus]